MKLMDTDSNKCEPWQWIRMFWFDPVFEKTDPDYTKAKINKVTQIY